MPLAACGTLLGSGKPDNLFRFGVPEREDVQVGTANAAPVTLSLARIRFAPEIEGDRILTARGESVLYIKDARWAAPAPDLFSQALARQFATLAPMFASARCEKDRYRCACPAPRRRSFRSAIWT
ncbi:hypothetical protein ACFSUK_05130 [Sphingobium scionense]